MRRVTAMLLTATTWACSPSDDDLPDARPDGRPDATDDGSPDDADVPADTPFACEIGVWGCYGNLHYQCGPDGATRLHEMPCPDACDATLGCVLCRPNDRRCEGNVSMLCAADGSAWITGRDCSEWGSTCDATGYCADACGEAESTSSYVGCEYWPVALANTSELDATAFDYRVIVANPNGSPAGVRITRGSTEVYRGTVPAGGLTEIPLPWVSGQSFGIPGGDWNSIVVADGAYRLRSDLPVTVSQWNPFEYSADGVFSYTNDATLLYPSHVLSGDYVAATYVPFSRASGMSGGPFPTPPDFMKYADYVAIVGIAPEPTDVEVWVAGETAAAAGHWDWTPPGGTIRFTLRRGEVAHVASAAPPDCRDDRPGWNREEECTFGMCDFMDTCREVDFDLTGSRIWANRPVEVFGGHVCAYVPYTSQACDHLEEQLAPIQTWGRDFVSAPMTDNGGPGENMVRVIAAFDDTNVTVEPPQGGLDFVTLHANQWVEFMAGEPFRVTGSRAIQVAQYILGQYYPEPDASRGDPALTILVPAEQYRSDYIFIAPSSYNPGTNGQSWVMIVRPPGLPLTLDGATVSADWRPIGDREIGIVPVAGGTHTIRAAEPFGLIEYGLGSFTSYASPAGLNLNPITILI